MRSMGLALSAAVCLVLVTTGCGGDDGGSPAGPPVAAPAPSPAPTPTPATPSPPPASATILFMTPHVSRANDSTGGRRISDAQLDANARLTLTEPGATAPAIENVTFNGNETYDLLQPNEPGSYVRRIAPSNFVGSNANQFNGGGFSRDMPQLVFQDFTNGTIMVLPLLEEARKTPQTARVTNNPTDHVRVADVRVSNTVRGFQLFGTRAGASAIAAGGTATFVGEAYGDFFLNTFPSVSDGLGDAVILVNYAGRQVSGRILVSQYLNPGPAIEVEFVADIVDGNIIGRTLTARGPSIFMAGTVQGSFYGASADELALVFSFSGAAGNVIGVVVAGRE